MTHTGICLEAQRDRTNLQDKDWGKTTRSFTPNGDGVDRIVKADGQDTMNQSLNAIKCGGHSGMASWLGSCLRRGFRGSFPLCRAVMIGSKAQFQDMVRAIEANDIQPVLDKTVFFFQDVKKAYKDQWDGAHVGKMAIKFN
ncbi:hypothetical protein DL546_004098 [Coniochaeta pulveracea]|uniref:Alcohol dehydrogenase-like C-terminal domain-containing protein n=1 Tax=Coniochaeta pulveracea TaxID=177199 RepID=A0A420XZV9_9PEZI|nr:hypothetical protein DL546_004098 [Coniochaeta pulveracea]